MLTYNSSLTAHHSDQELIPAIRSYSSRLGSPMQANAKPLQALTFRHRCGVTAAIGARQRDSLCSGTQDT